MIDERTARLRDELADADAKLDEAWATGSGLEEALDRVRRLSAELGRAPEIEDAKVAIARDRGCTPSEAYLHLVGISQRSNRKLRDAARELMQTWGGAESRTTPGMSRPRA